MVSWFCVAKLIKYSISRQQLRSLPHLLLQVLFFHSFYLFYICNCGVIFFCSYYVYNCVIGTPFRVGDTFTVKVTNIMPVPVNLGQVTHMGISSDGVAGLTPLNGDTMALQCGCTAELLFTVASLDNAIMWGILSGKFTTNLLLL